MSVVDLNTKAGKYVFSVKEMHWQNGTVPSKNSFFASCNNKKVIFKPATQGGQNRIVFSKNMASMNTNSREALCFSIDNSGVGRVCSCEKRSFSSSEIMCQLKTADESESLKEHSYNYKNIKIVALTGGAFLFLTVAFKYLLY